MPARSPCSTDVADASSLQSPSGKGGQSMRAWAEEAQAPHDGDAIEMQAQGQGQAAGWNPRAMNHAANGAQSVPPSKPKAREDPDERRALAALCGADLHTVAKGRSLAQHPLLHEEPSHIRFNAFPLAVMGGAWICQLPLMIFPYPPLVVLPFAYALSLLIGCISLSYVYPSWTMDMYHGNPLDALMRINTHSNSLVNAEDQFEKDVDTDWTKEKRKLAMRLRQKAKQKQLQRAQHEWEEAAQKLEIKVEALKVKQQRAAGSREGKSDQLAAELEELRSRRKDCLVALDAVSEQLHQHGEQQQLFADYKLVPTYFSYFFLVGFVVLSGLIAVSNFMYERSVVLPCAYHDTLNSFNVSTINGTDTQVDAAESMVFDPDSFSFHTVNVTESVPVDYAACLVAQAVRFSWLLFWSLVLLVQLTLAWHVTSKQDAVMNDSQRHMRMVVEPRLMAQIVFFIKAQHWDRFTLSEDSWRQGGAILLSLLAPLVQLAVMPRLLIKADVQGIVLYVALLPVGCVAAYTIQYLMYALSIIYWRNKQYMVMISLLMERFNLVRTAELLFSWWHVRELFRRVLMPVGYSLGAWGLTSLLLLTVTSVLVVVIVIFVAPQGIRVFFADPTLVLFLVLAVIALIILFRILIHAVSVYEEQQRHVEVMQRALLINQDDIALRIRTHFIGDAAAAEEQAEQEDAPLLNADAPNTSERVGGHDDVEQLASPTSLAAGSSSLHRGVTETNVPPTSAASEDMSAETDQYGDNFFQTMRYMHALSRGTFWPEIAEEAKNTTLKVAETLAIPAKQPAKEKSSSSITNQGGEKGTKEDTSLHPTAVSQEHRKRLLQSHSKQVARFQDEHAQLYPADGPAASEWSPSEQRDVVSSFSTLIKESDTFPAVLGIPIKPTLLQLVSGYVASAAVLIVGKFVSQIGF